MRTRAIMSAPVIVASPDATVKDAATIMLEHDIGALPVVDEAGGLVGIITEGDLVRAGAYGDPRDRIIAPEAGPQPHTVGEAMTIDVVTVDEDTDASQVARIMLARGLKHLPVVRGARVVGVVARRDVLATLARDDIDIEADVRARLAAEETVVGRLDARVRAGNVLIAGAADEQTRRLAEILARGVSGVIDVQFI